jgi:hypothetical protein
VGTVDSAVEGRLTAYAVLTAQNEFRYAASNNFLATAQLQSGGSGNGTLYAPRGVNWPLALSNLQVSPKTSISGSFSGAGDSGTFTFTYQAASTQPLALASLAGTFSATSSEVSNGAPISLVLDASGALTGTLNGNALTGTLALPSASLNAYTVVLNHPDGTKFNGLAFWTGNQNTGLTANALYVQTTSSSGLALGAVLKRQ